MCAVEEMKRVTSEYLEEVGDDVLHGGGVAALLGQVLHGLHRLLHQLSVVGFQLAWNAHG